MPTHSEFRQAAESLHEKLMGWNELLTIGMRETPEDGRELIVHLKKKNPMMAREIPEQWQGIPVISQVTGIPRPLSGNRP